MFKESINKPVSAIALAMLVATFTLSGLVIAAEPAMSAKEKRELVPKSSSEATSAITSMITELTKNVNKGSEPSEKFIVESDIKLKGARPFMTKFNNDQKCQYYLATAWVKHFSGDDKNAYLSAQKAFKTNTENLDARITEATMAMLMDRAPMKMPPKPRTQKNTNSYASKKSSLEFDIESIREDLIGRQISTSQVVCLNSTTLSYQPSQANLCVLFWCVTGKDGKPKFNEPVIETVVDPNVPAIDPNLVPMPESMNPRMMYRDRNGMEGKYSADKSRSFAADLKAFGDLYAKGFGNPEFQFVSVNTDNLMMTQQVLDDLMATPQPWAVTMAKLPMNGLEKFADVEVEKPTLAIIDKTGTVKYAGSPQGFLPKMILKKVGGMELADNAVGIASVEAPKINMANLSKAMSLLQKKPAQTQIAVPPTAAKTSTSKTNYRELEDFEAFDAQKQLQMAKDLFLPAGKKRILTPKRGVDICREIIRKYPNTKYAEEARTLLREEVNPRYRERYKLTDEELGL